MHPRRFIPWLALLFLTGCYPRLVWLPDSSGIVYTAGPRGNLLFVHDLSRGKPLVKELSGRVNVPAVSPDGRLLAVATLTAHQSGSRVRILALDRDGREVHRSDELPWRQDRGNSHADGHYGAEAYWSPSGGRLLVAGDNRVAFYDLKSRRLEMQAGMAGAGPLVFGGQWLCPKSKAFLLRRDNRFELVDWHGRAQPFHDGLTDTNLADKETMLAWPFIYSSDWDASSAHVAWGGHRLCFDTAKMAVSHVDARLEWTDDGKLVQQRFSFGKALATVRVVELEARNPNGGNDGRDGTFGTFRLELLRPGETKRHVLLPKFSGGVQLVPAPNRQRLAIDCLADSSDQQTMERLILVLDAHGRLLSQINTVFPVLGKVDGQ